LTFRAGMRILVFILGFIIRFRLKKELCNATGT
jgi:hypothetical protein